MKKQNGIPFVNKLNFKQKERLVELLLELPCIQDEAQRRMLLRELPSHIASAIQANDIPRVHVISIINSCIEYNDGLEYLLDVLRFFDGEKLSFQGVEDFITTSCDLKPSEEKHSNEDRLCITASPPDEWAILQVLPHGSQCQLILHASGSVILQTGPKNLPNLGLHTLFSDPALKGKFTEIKWLIDEYSSSISLPNNDNKLSLGNKLQSLCSNAHDGSLCLVIHDRTNFEIPWELMKFSDKNEYIGSSITTVRWQDFRTDKGD
ncbi:MAG: hypothetical protein GY862_03865, partial [Gammaproteobacteria bacterium]|nr:hypothetical protein [Gammaproteobacteria bacterium]